MTEKIVESPDSAVADIRDGATIMIGGFTGAGCPRNLIDALVRRGATGLTVICNSVVEADGLARAGRIKKLICGFAALPREVSAFEEAYRRGEAELEMVPQGTLLERVRAGGADIPAFFISNGAGTLIGQGKESRSFRGKEYVLETALTADYALIQAWKSDRLGNLVYHLTGRNSNPTMALAATVTIAEVEEIVPAGGLDPEAIVTPGVFVDRVVKAKKQVRWFRQEFAGDRRQLREKTAGAKDPQTRQTARHDHEAARK